MNTERLKDFGIGLGFVGLQIVMFRHLKVWNMQPDLVLIYILWLITVRDRTSCLFMAAALGLFQDALLDLWGLNMFSKTLITFAAYNFIPKSDKVRLLIGQIFLTVFIASLFHNIIFVGLSVIVESYSAEFLFWQQWLGNAVYTTLVAGLIQLFRTQ
ncbi:rod shape-determining protein MreD [Halalkalibaculum sp. DA3122]|uniref:rod shape-determining protein MreD n=1 Tax=Halalkalibaculum sp. DA3122 TaxID=3373607 RepID=UPI0037553D5B